MTLLRMLDSDVASEIPLGTPICAGYCDSPSQSYFGMRQRLPSSKVYSISTTGVVGANFFDFEFGTLPLSALIASCRLSVGKNYQTGVYTTPDNWNQEVGPQLMRWGIYAKVDWWAADWSTGATLMPDLWGRLSVAHQYYGTGTGPYDISVISSDFVYPAPPVPPPPPPGPPQKIGDKVRVQATVQIRGGNGWVALPDGITVDNLIGVVVVDLDPAIVGRYTPIPVFGGLTQDGKLVFGGSAPDGNYGVVVWGQAS
jgi:hypothetical protein